MIFKKQYFYLLYYEIINIDSDQIIQDIENNNKCNNIIINSLINIYNPLKIINAIKFIKKYNKL